MTVTGVIQGYQVFYGWDAGQWMDNAGTVFVLNARPCPSCLSKFRPCIECGDKHSPTYHDPCLGHLPGVENACCRHGAGFLA